MAHSPGRYDPDVLSFMVGYIAAGLMHAEMDAWRTNREVVVRNVQEIQEEAYQAACKSHAIKMNRSSFAREIDDSPLSCFACAHALHTGACHMAPGCDCVVSTRPAAIQREKE